jgi:hypothetical protein
MVEDRVTDGTRIAQLLASELTGLETGPLADVAVVGADPGVAPTPEGVRAYDVSYREERVGEVHIYPDRACVRLCGHLDAPDGDATPPVPVTRTDDGVVLSVESGAAVKRAVDVVRSVLAAV